jgi:glutathione S-transferase
MLTIHHLGISQSERIIWLCEELGVPYELKIYDRDPVTRLAPATYKALHPLGTAPIITDGDIVLPESGAIIDYIIAKYGNGRLALPPSHPNFADYLFWFHFANASLMMAEMGTMLIGSLDESGTHPISQMLGARSSTAYALVEQRLGEAPYFAGDEFTAADIIMFFPLSTMRAFNRRDVSAFPNLSAYLKRVGARPAYQRAMAKGDPNMAPFLN